MSITVSQMISLNRLICLMLQILKHTYFTHCTKWAVSEELWQNITTAVIPDQVCVCYSLWEADCMDSARLTLDSILRGRGGLCVWSWCVPCPHRANRALRNSVMCLRLQGSHWLAGFCNCVTESVSSNTDGLLVFTLQLDRVQVNMSGIFI